MATITASPTSASSGGSNWRTVPAAVLSMLVQLVISFLILTFCRGHEGIGIHIGHLVVITSLGAGFSVLVLRKWKGENPEPQGPPLFPWMLAVLVVALLCLVADGADCFAYEIYHGRLSPESITEGLNFSVQTVTTVGYGNWPLTTDPPTFGPKQFMELRTYSIFLMATGASVFTLVIGMTTTWLMNLK